jgi:7-carboxy-7-deazaguanine synthase
MTQTLLASPSTVTAPVLDVFASRQGEGPWAGDPHLFVRFGGCNLACNYCDTPESIPMRAGVPQGVDDLAARIDEVAAKFPQCRTISLTGGEPLLQLPFLQSLIPLLRRRHFKIYLETNGTLPAALEKIVDQCDYISMDFKPASATGRELWEAHRWFLNASGSKVFVKLVLTDTTVEEELHRTVALLRSVRQDIPLILQPATPFGGAGSIPMERLASWWEWAASRLRDVRILPQLHRIWEIP